MSAPFLDACRGERPARTPVWIMRQAGRYLPEYRALREKRSFWEMCTIPEVACEVTLQPIRRLGVDAAILFSDILVPLPAMGMSVDFRPAPVIESPIRTAADIDRLKPARESGIYARVAEAVRLIRSALPPEVALIGFAGAPFTVATYAVCGGGSKSQAEIRSLLHSSPESAHRLLVKMTDAIVASIESQIDAGAQAVQLFDSWAGVLGPEEYERFAFAYAKQVFDRVASRGVPRIYFAPAAMHHLSRIAGIGADVLGIDWRIGLDVARSILGPGSVLQGNMDPAVLLADAATIGRKTREMLDRGSGGAHIMNLGHGILPETPVENARAFVETARSWDAEGRER